MKELNPVIIFGAKGLAPVILDAFQSNGVVVYGFLDDDASLHNTEIDNVPVLGSPENEGFTKLIGKKCDAFVAIDDTRGRRRTTEDVIESRSVMPCNAIHASALISPSAVLGHGNLLAAGAIVSAQAEIGSHNLILPGAILEHKVTLGDYVQVSAGVRIGTGATLADDVFVGTGAVIVPGISVGKGARIGAGSVVVEPVPAGATVFGNPAKKI